MDAPLIIDVKHHSLEDGPGIRSVVFFKGCPLRCDFCQNPESQERGLEVAFTASRCIGCGHCAEACPSGAIDVEGAARIRRDRCQRCGACAGRCPPSALRAIGFSQPPGALAEVLLRDEAFYRHSGGGVTLSGGEATLHLDYLADLLRALKAEGIHTALQTCGDFELAAFEARVLPLLDLIFFDVKLADPEEHRAHTGRSNRRILENLRRLLAARAVEVLPTVPLVPGVTATATNLEAIAALLLDAGAPRVRLLPYNPLGLHMAESLGRARPPLCGSFMRPDELDAAQAIFERALEHEQRRTRPEPAK
jgi:pyruvate formate lyase activating enzyme